MIKYLFISISLISLQIFAGVKTIDKIVATVNNEVILESDISNLEKNLANPQSIDESLLFDSTVASLKNNRKAIIQYLIFNKLIESEIKKLNLSITEERVNKELLDLATRNNLDLKGLESALKLQGFSLIEYKSYLKNKIEKQNLLQSEILSKFRVSDEDAYSEFLKLNPTRSMLVNEFTLAHIFFNPKKGSSEDAENRAISVLNKLKVSLNFEQLAEQFSEDPNFSSGGYLGTFKNGEFLPEIEKEIKLLNKNEFTRVIQTKLGYHIVKVLDKKNSLDPKFENEKENIKGQIIEKNFKRQFKIWLENKQEESYTSINE